MNIAGFFQELSNLPKTSKIGILSILLLCLFAGFVLPALLTKNSTSGTTGQPTIVQTRPTLTPVPVPATLGLSADKTSVPAGTPITVTIQINSGTYSIGAADFVLKFDPTLLTPQKIDTGTFFKEYPKSNINANTVAISGVASVVDDSVLIPKGEGTIAQITFQTLAKGNAVLEFDSAKTIVASDGKNVLGQAKTLTIGIE